jgi:hypothetical protein
MITLLSAALATLVFCAPGYPGGAGDAQPYLDEFSRLAAAAAGWPAGSLASVYDPTAEGGLARLQSADASVAFVPYPFYVEQAAALHLSPLAQADVANVGTTEKWTLVARVGKVTGPASLSGYTILSVAGYAPEFVRHVALAGFTLPADVKIEPTGQILSALRRVAAGEPVAALLDSTQMAALPSLPFAAQIQTVTESPVLPVALVALVGTRLPAARAHALQAGLLKLGHTGSDAGSLGTLRLNGFVSPKLPATPRAP